MDIWQMQSGTELMLPLKHFVYKGLLKCLEKHHIMPPDTLGSSMSLGNFY